MKIETDGGTVFVTGPGKQGVTQGVTVVTITRHDAPETTIPLADLREFIDLVDLEDDDEEVED